MEEEIKPQADNLLSKVISGMKTVFDNVSLLSSDRKHKPYKRPRPRYFAAVSSVSATPEGAAEIPPTVVVEDTNNDKMAEKIVQENVETPQKEEIQVKGDEVIAAEVAPKFDKTTKSPKKKKEKKSKNKERGEAVKVKNADISDMEQSSQPTMNKQNEESKEEPSSKPRIVLKIRSEKHGPKDTDVKLVCESDKPPKSKSFKRQKSKQLLTRRFASRNAEKKSEETSGSSMKRSTRRLSKEYSENILANAIARKQKSFNEMAPAKRRIKPTAKILANAEMRLGLESQNIARLQSAPVRTRRSMRALTTETLEKETIEKKNMNARKKMGKVAKDNASSDGIKDDIKENEAELSKIESSSEEMEAQRLNRLKRKHLSMLGLRAIVKPENGQSMSDDLVDDSTMDSTELEALTEHLSLHPSFDREKQVPQKLIVSFDESVIVTEKVTTTPPKRPSSEVAPEETTALRKLRSSGWRKQSLIDSVSAINRSSQMSPIIVETIDDKDPESMEIVQNIVGCLCNEPTNLYIAPKMVEDPVYCKAVDHIDKLQVGCCHLASKEDDSPDSEYSPLVRASVRSPFILACHMHRARMAMHHCCPGCGLFCTQGTFYQCSRGHFFHPDCVLPHPIALQSELRYTGDCDLPLGCPHCGVDRVIMQNVNSEIWIVTIEMDCSSRSIIIPYQRMDLCPTYLSFRPPKNDSKHTAKAHVPVPRRILKRDDHPIVPPSMLPTIPIDLEALRVGKMRMIDYDDVLIGAANVESPQEDLYSAILNKDNYANVADRILAALALHANPHKRLLAVENGTYLHLAAKEFNLAAVHILCCMKCSLDALDNQARTPLMVAILNFDGDLCMGDQTKRGDTANEVLYAMKMSVIRYFVKGGSNVMQKGPDGLTCLHLAAKCGNVTACEILLDSLPYLKVPAYMNLQDEGGWTALVWAAENKHTEVVKFLLSRGADLSIADTERNTALHWAALAGCATTLQTLLTSDSCQSEDVDFPNVHGDTPLHVCARQDYYQCVVALLAKGARVDLKNASNETPLDASPDEKGECFRAMSLNSQLSILTNGRIWKKPTILSNDISVGREPYPIACLNEVDDAELPQNFFYISENCHEGQLTINTNINSMQGCSCESGNCSSDSCSCVDLSMKCWYDEEGRLVKDFDYADPPMVFECNGTCCCNRLTCQSTVIGRRRGTSVFTRVQVYRLNNLTNRISPDGFRGSMIGSQRVCGWGLRAMTPIPCGSPVAQYCGEILTSCEADKRIQDEYMFSLDGMEEYSENESSTTYCIDASTRGSASRFINHSCSANLTPVKVFTWHRDMRLPNVIFFASRDITAGEELTFDYGDKFWSVKYRLFHCICNSDVCRYPNKAQRSSVTANM